MITRKERLHRIWMKLEDLFTNWVNLSDAEKFSKIKQILEDARNSEQIEILRDEAGITSILSEMLDLLREIQRSQKSGMGAPDNVYCPHLRIENVDRLAGKVSEILDNGMEEGAIGESSRETT
jgi:hypothetical protein